MLGPGIYTTAEGDVYSGTWEADRLGVDNVNVTYADGSRYEGLFKDWSYNGSGKYTYPDGSVLMANFVENTPIHALTLIDPNGHTWLGTAEQGFGWFDPVNHFYDMLEKTRESKMKRYRPSLLPAMAHSTVSDIKKRKSVVG